MGDHHTFYAPTSSMRGQPARDPGGFHYGDPPMIQPALLELCLNYLWWFCVLGVVLLLASPLVKGMLRIFEAIARLICQCESSLKVCSTVFQDSNRKLLELVDVKTDLMLGMVDDHFKRVHVHVVELMKFFPLVMTFLEDVKTKWHYTSRVRNWLTAGTLGLGLVSWCFPGKDARCFDFLKVMPQGKSQLRHDVNRGGYFVTCLLSLCMLVLAPFMGAKKILSLVKPLIDLLKAIPQATFIVDWISHWFKGEVDIDDMPINDREMYGVEFLGFRKEVVGQYKEWASKDVHSKADNISEITASMDSKNRKELMDKALYRITTTWYDSEEGKERQPKHWIVTNTKTKATSLFKTRDAILAWLEYLPVGEHNCYILVAGDAATPGKSQMMVYRYHALHRLFALQLGSFESEDIKKKCGIPSSRTDSEKDEKDVEASDSKSYYSRMKKYVKNFFKDTDEKKKEKSKKEEEKRSTELKKHEKILEETLKEVKTKVKTELTNLKKIPAWLGEVSVAPEWRINFRHSPHGRNVAHAVIAKGVKVPPQYAYLLFDPVYRDNHFVRSVKDGWLHYYTVNSMQDKLQEYARAQDDYMRVFKIDVEDTLEKSKGKGKLKQKNIERKLESGSCEEEVVEEISFTPEHTDVSTDSSSDLIPAFTPTSLEGVEDVGELSVQMYKYGKSLCGFTDPDVDVRPIYEQYMDCVNKVPSFDDGTPLNQTLLEVGKVLTQTFVHHDEMVRKNEEYVQYFEAYKFLKEKHDYKLILTPYYPWMRWKAGFPHVFSQRIFGWFIFSMGRSSEPTDLLLKALRTYWRERRTPMEITIYMDAVDASCEYRFERNPLWCMTKLYLDSEDCPEGCHETCLFKEMKRCQCHPTRVDGHGGSLKECDDWCGWCRKAGGLCCRSLDDVLDYFEYGPEHAITKHQNPVLWYTPKQYMYLQDMFDWADTITGIFENAVTIVQRDGDILFRLRHGGDLLPLRGADPRQVHDSDETVFEFSGAKFFLDHPWTGKDDEYVVRGAGTIKTPSFYLASREIFMLHKQCFVTPQCNHEGMEIDDAPVIDIIEDIEIVCDAKERESTLTEIYYYEHRCDVSYYPDSKEYGCVNDHVSLQVCDDKLCPCFKLLGGQTLLLPSVDVNGLQCQVLTEEVYELLNSILEEPFKENFFDFMQLLFEYISSKKTKQIRAQTKPSSWDLFKSDVKYTFSWCKNRVKAWFEDDGNIGKLCVGVGCVLILLSVASAYYYSMSQVEPLLLEQSVPKGRRRGKRRVKSGPFLTPAQPGKISARARKNMLENQCIHYTSCPKKLGVDVNKECNTVCEGHHCTHFVSCKPEMLLPQGREGVTPVRSRKEELILEATKGKEALARFQEVEALKNSKERGGPQPVELVDAVYNASSGAADAEVQRARDDRLMDIIEAESLFFSRYKFGGGVNAEEEAFWDSPDYDRWLEDMLEIENDDYEEKMRNWREEEFDGHPYLDAYHERVGYDPEEDPDEHYPWPVDIHHQKVQTEDKTVVVKPCEASKNVDRVNRAIFQARTRPDPKPTPKEFEDWYTAQVALLKVIREKGNSAVFKKQAIAENVNESIFKFYVNGKYACTATLVGDRLFVVLHALVEGPAEYLAQNFMYRLKLDASTLLLHGAEIGSFKVNGIPSALKKQKLKEPTKSGTMVVIGFGDGTPKIPTLKVGFGSASGWVNADTVCGDCSSPVFNQEGHVVGFWTHGNNQAADRAFGRFEPVNASMLDSIGAAPLVHKGLDFRSPPQLL